MRRAGCLGAERRETPQPKGNIYICLFFLAEETSPNIRVHRHHSQRTLAVARMAAPQAPYRFTPAHGSAFDPAALGLPAGFKLTDYSKLKG